jgi:hypothetical protein
MQGGNSPIVFVNFTIGAAVKKFATNTNGIQGLCPPDSKKLLAPRNTISSKDFGLNRNILYFKQFFKSLKYLNGPEILLHCLSEETAHQ